MDDLAIKGATVVTPRGRARLHCYVTGGRITRLTAADLDAAQTVDGTGLHLLPGMVDTHVHLMDPGAPEREDFPTGTAAAALAGVTTIVEHTHAAPVRTVDDLEAKRHHLRERSSIDYGLAAHVWPGAEGDLQPLWAAGIAFFKIFTCTTHGIPGLGAADLQSAFQTIARAGGTCLVHGEDEALTGEAERLLRAAGRDDPAIVTEWRSREAELVAVAVTALLARLTGVRANVAHVSSPDVAALIARERAAGADLLAEACPQYFLLREDEVLDHGAFRKFTPPARARTAADEDRMWALLRDGTLGFLSTDHAPSTPEQKREGGIWDVHFGLPGIDTTLPLLLDAAARGRLALEDVARVYAEAPARRYGLGGRKGRIAVGADADLVLVDTAATWTLTDDDVVSKAGWTPYAGRRVTGRPVATYLRGEPIAQEGKVIAERRGRFVPGPGGPQP